MSEYKNIYKSKKGNSQDFKKYEQFLFIISLIIIFSLIYQNYNTIFWYILFGFVVFGGVYFYLYRYYKNYKLLKFNTFEKICTMDPFDFEKLCAKILQNKGHSGVFVTQEEADGGVDIFSTKDNIKYVIQCKRYNGNNYVTVMQVRELFGVAKSLGDLQSMIICTGYFSKDAIKFALRNNIIIINKEKFISDFLPFVK